MKVTVRTLDSKSTTFDVDEDETVKQFKEKVAPKLGIPVESQRVIFKGRVLQDDKLMKDYNVDGCVIHLVQRAPPSTSTPASSTASRGTSTSTTRPSTEHQSNLYIGTFQGVNDMTNVTQQLVENLLSTFGGAHGAATVTTSSLGNGTAVNVHIDMQAENQHSLPSDAERRLDQAQRFIASARTRLQNLEIGADSSQTMDTDEPSQPEISATRTGSDAESGERQSTQNSSPQSLANTIKDFQELYSQLEPSLSRYRELLNNPRSENRVASDDSLPDGIAEIFHNLSHGLHALSDLTFNFHSPEPQTVGCFPRMSPVTMPRNINPRTSTNVSSQSSETSVPTSTSSTVGQPHFHIQPHPHVHVHHRHGQNEAGTANGQQNRSAAPNPQGPFEHHRPIGVSATVIQIPRLQTAYGLPQTSTMAASEPSQPISVSAPSSTGSAPFSFPSLFSTVQQSIASGMAGAFRPPGTASTALPRSTGPIADGVNVTAPSFASSTSSLPPNQNTFSTQRATSGVPFGLNPMNQNALAGHPDPLVPCQSFHFGPRFQQAEGQLQGGRQIVAEVSSVMIEHIRDGVPSQASHDHVSTQNPTSATATSATTAQSAGSANIPSSVHSSQSVLGQNIASAILGDIFAQHNYPQQQQEQHQQPNQQQNRQPQRHEEPRLNVLHSTESDDDDADNDEDEELIDINDTGLIYEEVQRAVMNALTVPGNSQTMREFIDTRFRIPSDEGTEEEQAGMIFEMMSLVAEHLTINDMLQLVVGNSVQPLIRLAPHFLRFVETHFNGGEKLTMDNIPSVSENIIESMTPLRETLVSLCYNSDIDVPATIRQIDTEFYREALVLLINHERSSFVEDMSSLLKRYLCISVAVFDRCVMGGTEEFIQAMMNSENGTRMLSNVEPSMRDMFTSMLTTRVRSTAENGPQLSPDELQSKFVKKRQEASRENQHESQATASEKTDKKEEIRERIDINAVWEERNGGRICNGDGDDDDDDDYQPPSEYQEWHRHVPPEWIAVITKDAKRQHVQTAQRPFSDAYYNGLPAKRRRAIGEARNTDRGVEFNAALQNSIASANVQPLTSQSDLSNDLDQQELSEAFQDSFRQDVRIRLEQDPDYKPGKFPKSHEYFFEK